MASLTDRPQAVHAAIEDTDTPARWGAVYAMALCSFVLVAAEFLPVSLLSPIAQSLQLTEGQAGQAITGSGIAALVTSLSFSSLLGRTDRRVALLAFTALLIVSGVIVATAPNFPILMIGRVLIGIAIGGFWSMSAAIAMRLVPKESVAKALAVINGGNALATTLAAPLGSFLGGLVGWRGTFWCVVPLAIAAVAWQAITLPSLPVAEHRTPGSMFALLRRPALTFGLITVALLFAGQFTLFTYLRPFLEQVTHVSVSMLSLMLLVVGVAGLAGTILVGRILDRHLLLTLVLFPTIMAAVAVALALLGGSLTITALLLAIWGFTATAAPVAWWTWLARTVPDNAEAGGGLMVAIIQLAITVGASLGGFLIDALGPTREFMSSAVLLVIAAGAAFVLGRVPGSSEATRRATAA